MRHWAILGGFASFNAQIAIETLDAESHGDLASVWPRSWQFLSCSAKRHTLEQTVNSQRCLVGDIWKQRTEETTIVLIAKFIATDLDTGLITNWSDCDLALQSLEMLWLCTCCQYRDSCSLLSPKDVARVQDFEFTTKRQFSYKMAMTLWSRSVAGAIEAPLL